MKKLLRRLPIVVVVASVAGLLVYGFWPVPLAVEVAQVEQGTLLITVDEDGKTRIRERYVVSAPVYGNLFRIDLEAGDPVISGETELVRIQPRDPELLDARAEAEATARVQAAEATVRQAEARQIHANEAYELAEHELERARSLRAKKAIPQSDFDAAEHSERMAQVMVRAAEFSVTVARFELGLAEAGLVRTTPEYGQDGSELNLKILAPVDGTVLRVIREDAGIVSPATALLELGDPRDLEMEIDVLSTDAVKIHPGAELVVEHWGGDTPLAGVVRRVEPAAYLKISALGVEEQRVNVLADFTSPWEERQSLGDSYRIEASIVIDEADDVLIVPTGTLFRHEGAWHTFQIVETRAVLTPVSTGRTNGRVTEIITGLSEGDEIVMYPSDQLFDGCAVASIGD